MDEILAKNRAIDRNEATWVNLDGAGYAGDLAFLETVVNGLGDALIQQHLTIIDEEIAFEAQLREQLHDLDMQEVAQDKQLALEKYQTSQQVLAYKIAGENYLLEAREYELMVEGLIMAAKEFAAQVEREQVALEKDRAIMAVRREEARLKEIGAQILLEQYEQKRVEVDLARAKLDVARSNVQVVMADIAVEEANLKVIQANLETAMAVADKATLESDVALILADIIVRALAQVKFEVESAEIEAGFAYIQQELSDMLELWRTRTLTEEVKRDAEYSLREELDRLTEAQKALEDLRLTQQQAEADIWNYEKSIIEALKNEEEVLREGAHVRRLDVAEDKSEGRIQTDKKQLWAKLILNRAKQWVYKNAIYTDMNQHYWTQVIHKGIYTPGFAEITVGDDMCG